MLLTQSHLYTSKNMPEGIETKRSKKNQEACWPDKEKKTKWFLSKKKKKTSSRYIIICTVSYRYVYVWIGMYIYDATVIISFSFKLKLTTTTFVWDNWPCKLYTTRIDAKQKYQGNEIEDLMDINLFNDKGGVGGGGKLSVRSRHENVGFRKCYSQPICDAP